MAFEVDRLRRDHHELIGELAVRCSLPGARTFDSSLSLADFNLSSARARSERARLLAERSRASTLDWPGLLEEFCQRVLQADRTGQPAVDLRDLPDAGTDDSIKIEGFTFPRRHPTVIFGDGGTAKSYTALYLAGRMAERGMAVALFDWELAGDDHRDRLKRLFGQDWPRVVYARCERALVFETDRLKRIVREHQIDYAIYDSVALASDGPAEAAEAAAKYFQAVRQIGVGSVHIAHVSKADGADQKPFGSVFWHNCARSTWYVKLAEASTDTDVLYVGFFNRKANLGRLCAPVGFTITFTDERTLFHRTEIGASPDLAGQLSIRQRMAYLLRRGAMAPEAIAEEIDADVETVKRTARRYRKLFTVLDGGRFALLERTGS
ncbi:MAG: AAA family ATPase [Acidobacteriota bacterium]